MLGIKRRGQHRAGRLSDFLGVPMCTSPACSRDLAAQPRRILVAADSAAVDDLSPIRRALGPKALFEGATVVLYYLATARAAAAAANDRLDEETPTVPSPEDGIAREYGSTVVMAPAGCRDVAECARTTSPDLVLVPESWAYQRWRDRLTGTPSVAPAPTHRGHGRTGSGLPKRRVRLHRQRHNDANEALGGPFRDRVENSRAPL